MYENRHLAKCSNCGHIAKTSSSGTFIRHFALPDICAACGEDMHERSDDLPHWTHVIVKLKRTKPAKTRNPLTWFKISEWVEVDRHEMHAG